MKSFSEVAIENAVMDVLDHIIIHGEVVGYQRDALSPLDISSRVLVELGADDD